MNWGAFFSAFGLVFLAEFGDKTQLAVVTQTCKYGRPWAVFAGATGALITVTALGAIGGQALGSLIPKGLLHAIAAFVFVVMGLFIAWEASKAGRTHPSSAPSETPGEESTVRDSTWGWDWGAFSSTFGLLFVAELGDKTQLAVLSLSGKHGAVWAVFAGGALALTLVTALGVAGGQALSAMIPQRALRWVSAVAFLAMGALMAAGLL